MATFLLMVSQLPPPADRHRSSNSMKRTTVVPLIAAMVLLAVVVSVNLHGLRNCLTSPNPANVLLSFDPWIHGWPFEYSMGVGDVYLRVRFGNLHRWVVPQSTADVIPICVLGLNLFVGTSIAVAVFFMLRTLIEKLKWKMRFTIRSALVMTTVIAAGFAVRNDMALFVEVYHLDSAFSWLVVYVCCIAVALVPMVTLARLLYAGFIRHKR